MLLVLLAGVTGYQTIAYTTVESTSTNVITAGKVTMELIEKTYTGSVDVSSIEPADIATNNDFSDYPTDAQEYGAGKTFSKIVYIENTGTEPYYGRIYLEAVLIDGGVETSIEDELEFDIDTDKWVEDTEGWYRYVDIVEAGDFSDYFFTTVTFPTTIDNAYLNKTIEIRVKAQAVQSEHNEYDEDDGSVLDVKGWPADEGVN